MKEVAAFILVLVAVEAVTEIIGESGIFAPLRSLLKPVPYVGGLLDCRYCLSVWVAFAGAFAFPYRVIPGSSWPWIVADFLVLSFALHRMANVLHEAVYRFLERMPFRYVPMEVVDDEPPRGGDSTPDGTHPEGGTVGEEGEKGAPEGGPGD